jgi:NAD-dependent dihydropyrimidine dehydrogenase PreA subunit/DNA-binding MarR family transcriptional regulator
MEDIYEKVRQRLDMFPQGFPKTASGVELEILRRLFTPEEGEIMLALRPAPESASVVAKRLSRDTEEMGKQLYGMSKKGLILRTRTPDGQILYGLAPWIVGIWEWQLNNLDQELARLKERYTEEGMLPERRKTKISGMRTIPVEKEIIGASEIEPYEKVSEILNSHTKFAVSDCICRKEQKLMGKGCDKLMEACMTFGPAADYYIENGLGREITREEARAMILKAEEQGLVHCSSNQKGAKLFMCNCCGCCCGVLQAVNKHNIPAAMTKSNYFAKVDPETCTGCESCVDRCQVNAIQVQDGIARIEKAKCIGCGLCVSTCPTASISLVHKEKDDLPIIFPDPLALVQAIGKEKGKAFPFE